MEEIQAESAAYYSYEPHDYLRSAGGGKDKKISTVRTPKTTTAIYSRDKPGNPERKTQNQDLTFKVLTLEEIRRRKNTSKELIKPQEQQTKTEHCFEDTVKTVKELQIIKKIIPTTRKRSLATSTPEEHDLKRQKIVPIIVPPIRLRRSPKRFMDTTKKRESPRKTEIEVRLCDSSTSDDSNIQNISTIESKDVKLDEIKNEMKNIADPTEDLRLEQFIDDHSNDGDYLDTASDDILKDIDAMLTEKSV